MRLTGSTRAFSKTKNMEKGRTNGAMEENTVENGSSIECMDKVDLYGVMVEYMKANIVMINKKVMEHLHGLMAGSTMDNG